MPAEQRALWEAAIQLDLVTADKAEALVAQRTTVGAWLADQKLVGNRKARTRGPFDRLLVFALILFNLLVLAGAAAAIVWVFGALA